MPTSQGGRTKTGHRSSRSETCDPLKQRCCQSVLYDEIAEPGNAKTHQSNVHGTGYLLHRKTVGAIRLSTGQHLHWRDIQTCTLCMRDRDPSPPQSRHCRMDSPLGNASELHAKCSHAREWYLFRCAWP